MFDYENARKVATAIAERLTLQHNLDGGGHEFDPVVLPGLRPAAMWDYPDYGYYPGWSEDHPDGYRAIVLATTVQTFETPARFPRYFRGVRVAEGYTNAPGS